MPKYRLRKVIFRSGATALVHRAADAEDAAVLARLDAQTRNIRLGDGPPRTEAVRRYWPEDTRENGIAWVIS